MITGSILQHIDHWLNSKHFDHWPNSTTFWSLAQLYNILITDSTLNILITDSTLNILITYQTQQHFDHWTNSTTFLITNSTLQNTNIILITDPTLQHFDHWLNSTTLHILITDSILQHNNILVTDSILQHYNILITDPTLQHFDHWSDYNILITDSILQHFCHWPNSITFWSLIQLYSTLITKFWHITLWDHQWYHETRFDKSRSREWKYYAYSIHKISNYMCGECMCDLATEEPKAKEHFSRQKMCLSLFKYPFLVPEFQHCNKTVLTVQ